MKEFLECFKEYDVKKAAPYWGLLCLAFFLINGGWVLKSFALYLTKRPLSLGLQLLCTGTASLIGLFLLCVFAQKAFGRFKSLISCFPTLLAGTLFLAAVAGAVPLILKAWAYYLAAMLRQGDVNGWAAALLLAALLLVLAVFAVFAGMAACIFILYGVPVRKTGRAAAALAEICLRRFPVFLFIVLAGILFGAGLFKIMQLIEAFLKEILPYGFYARYVLEILLAGVKTLFAFFLFGSVQFVMYKDRGRFAEKINQGNGSPAFLAGAALLAAGLVLCNVWPYIDVQKQVLKNIEARIIKGDNLRNIGQSGAASAEYLRAEGDLTAFSGYLAGIKEIRENGEIREAMEILDKAEEMCPDSPYVPYFKGMLQKTASPRWEDDPDINSLFASAALKSTGKNAALLPEVRLWTFSSFWAAGEKKKAREEFNLAVARGIFGDRFEAIASAEEKRLDELNQEAARLVAMLRQRELYVLMNRAEYEDENSLLWEFLEYTRRHPGPEGFYQAALIAERIPYPEYMYEFARKYFAARTKGEGEEEIRAALLTSYMYVKSGHLQEAEELMKEMYGKYPGNKEIACDYSYTLLENKKPEQALAVIKAQGARDPSLLYLQAVAFEQIKDYPQALETLSLLCREAENKGAAPGEIRKIDEYLYRFLLEYQELSAWGTAKGQDFVFELKKKQEPALVYHYVLGLEARQAENYEESNMHFARLLELNPHLAYPYYLLGVNYNEMAGYLKQDCYPLAEKNFLQFLEHRPDAVEGYFCLGMVYKHMGDLVKAERAFRKVVALNPRRDNPLYEPYSMYNHALAEIEKIKEKGQK